MWPLSAKQIYEIMMGEICPHLFFSNLVINGVCQDSRKLKTNEMFIAIKGDHYDGHHYLKECLQNHLSIALAQKDSPVLNELTAREKERCICVTDVTNSLRKLAKYMRASFSFPVIGIGGSNGKTTTKEILYNMLMGDNNKVTKTDKSENGYLGLPITLLQEGHNILQPPTHLVLEIGIDEIGAMQSHIEVSKPNIVLLTALGPEHLTGLNNWETAAKEELILFSNPKIIKIWQLADKKIKEFYFNNLKSKRVHYAHDYVVVEQKNYNNYLRETLPYKKTKGKTEIVWHIEKESDIFIEVALEIHNLISRDVSEPYTCHIPLPGKHNAANFALAFAAALAVGKTSHEILTGFKNFVPPPMRSNIVTLPNGALLYNDSYNASPLSVTAALQVLENPSLINKPKLIVLGDMRDLGIESNYWHESLVPTIIKLKHTLLCLYGSAMYSCYKLLEEMKDKLLLENDTRIFWLDSDQDPGRFFDNISCVLGSYLILVKGSRGMRLERFVKLVEEKCNEGVSLT